MLSDKHKYVGITDRKEKEREGQKEREGRKEREREGVKNIMVAGTVILTMGDTVQCPVESMLSNHMTATTNFMVPVVLACALNTMIFIGWIHSYTVCSSLVVLNSDAIALPSTVIQLLLV